jgi:hypothetical protein
MTNRALDSALTGIQFYFWTPMVFQHDPAKKSARTATSRDTGRRKASMSYRSCSRTGGPVALRTEQLNDKDIGPILQEV